MTTLFPSRFLWGAATGAHQVEGNNTNSDWWLFEHQPGAPLAEPSGDACDSYHRYREDIALLAQLGLNAYRFSIEWARIEPAPGEFSRASLDHYRRVCETCAEFHIQPLITFQHVTLPAWVGAHGGWLWDEIPERFARYAGVAAEALRDQLHYVVTVSEPDINANVGYRYGAFPGAHMGPGEGPGEAAAARAAEMLCRAHHLGRQAIHAAAPQARVGLTLAVQEWGVQPGYETVLADLQRQWEGDFFAATAGDDFVGVQAYTRIVAGPVSDQLPEGFAALIPLFNMYPPGTRRTTMGYEFRPQAIGAAIRRASTLTGLPIMVTENGVPTDDDRERVEYLDGSLAALRECLADGIDVRGYFHWSLLDNFEWHQGYRMHFGLVEVDRATFARKPKPSAIHYGQLVRAAGAVPD